MSTIKTLKDIGKLYQNTKPSERKYDPKKQSEGYEKRMEGSGIDVKKATDTRNIVEKALNLREDQNVLFDVFEVINRPQQALFAAIDAAQNNEDILKGASKGLRGQKRMQFKEILHNSGMEETEGKLGFDDVLGFAGDVFLDPMDLGIGKVNKLTKATKKLSKAENAVKKVAERADEYKKLADMAMDNLVNTAPQANKLVDSLYKKQHVANRYKKALKTFEKAQELEKAGKHISKVSGTQMAFGLIGSGIRGTFSLTDTGLTEMFKIMDVTSFQNTLKFKGVEKASAKIMGEGNFKMLHRYEGIKELMENTFNWASKIPENFLTNIRKLRGEERFVSDAAQVKVNALIKKLKNEENGLLNKISEDLGVPIADVERAVLVAHEKGKSLFDASGNVTRAGMRTNFKIEEMLIDEGFLMNTGVTDDVAIRLEEFVKTYMPDEYRKYVSDSNPMFVKSDLKSDVVIDTQRVSNPALLKDIKDKLYSIKLPESDYNAKVRSTILGDEGKELFDSLPDAQKQQITKIQEDIDYYENLRKKTKSKHAWMRASKGQKEFSKLEADFEVLKKERIAAVKKIAKAETLKESPESIEALFKLKDDIELAIVENKQKIGSLWDDHFARIDDGSSDIIDIQKHLANQKANIKALDSKYGFKKVDAEGVLELMQEELTIPSFFTDKAIGDMNKILQHDAVDEVLNDLYTTMSDIVDLMKTKMGANFDHHEYYIAHTLTDEWKALNVDKAIEVQVNKWLKNKEVMGNTQLFAKRRYQTSIVEANELAKGYVDYLVSTGKVTGKDAESLLKGKSIQMFADDITTSMLDFATKAPKAAGDAQMLAYVLRTTLLQEDDAVMRFRNKSDVKIPFGFTELNSESFKYKMKGMEKYLGTDGEMQKLAQEVNEFLTKHENKRIFINNNINKLIGRVVDPNETIPLVGFMNSLNNIFKKNKLLSPGFQIRNVAGNVSNMWLSGMPMNDIMTYNRRAAKIMKNGEKLFQAKQIGEVISKSDEAVLAAYEEFLGNGFTQLGNALHDIPEELWNTEAVVKKYQANSKHIENLQKKIQKLPSGNPEKAALVDELRIAKLNKHVSRPKEAYDKLVAFNMRMNTQQDEMFRMSLYLYAKEHPEYLIDSGVEDAASAVRRVLFDYQDLSVVEQDYMRKMIPFYTFMKKNLGFQINNLLKKGNKYNQLQKAFNSVWGILDLEPEEMDRFKIENFWLPIPVKSKDGKYSALKISLPLGDLGEFLDNPIQRTLSATAPVFRAPFELAMNKQVFSGMPIQEFKGQKGFMIPELSRGAEFGLNQLGLDVPAAMAADIGRTAVGVAKGDVNNPLEAAQSALGRTIVSQGDAAKSAERAAYDRLDLLEDLMRYYKQEGIEIKTIAELENAGIFKKNQGISERLRALRSK